MGLTTCFGKYATLLFLFIAPTIIHAQTFAWAHNQAGGVSTTDTAGNVYTIGWFKFTVDFDAGPGVYNMTAAGTSNADCFILKQDSSGGFIWAKQIASTGTGYLSSFASITVDEAGNIYASGNFVDTIDFDPGPGVFKLGTSSMDYFLLKLDPSGNFIWAKNAGNATGISYIMIAGHCMDEAGNIFAVFSFKGTIDADPGPGINNFSTASVANLIADLLVLKLDSAGNLIWARQAGGHGINVPGGIAIDGADNIYLAGSFNDTSDFDPGPDTAILHCFGSQNFIGDVFITKWDSAGSFIWARQVGGSSSEAAAGIAVDKRGYSSTVGYFSGTADFDPGPGVHNIHTTKASAPFAFGLTPSGDLSWAEGMETLGETRSVATDTKGNIYLGGSLVQSADFDPGPGTYMVSPGGGQDAFVQKLDSAGNFLWAFALGSNGNEGVNKINTDRWDNVFVFGAYQYDVDFDPGPGVYNMNGNLTSYFLLKLGPALIATGVEPIPGSVKTDISVYPNPVTGSFSITGPVPGQYLWLADLSGRVLRTWTSVPQHQEYNISDLAAGYYLLHIEDAEHRVIATKAVIKR